jgi:hypothetical protein
MRDAIIVRASYQQAWAAWPQHAACCMTLALALCILQWACVPVLAHIT